MAVLGVGARRRAQQGDRLAGGDATGQRADAPERRRRRASPRGSAIRTRPRRATDPLLPLNAASSSRLGPDVRPPFVPRLLRPSRRRAGECDRSAAEIRRPRPRDRSSAWCERARFEAYPTGHARPLCDNRVARSGRSRRDEPAVSLPSPAEPVRPLHPRSADITCAAVAPCCIRSRSRWRSRRRSARTGRSRGTAPSSTCCRCR